MKPLLAAAAAIAPLLLSACESETPEPGDSSNDDGMTTARACDDETRDDFAIGLTRTGSIVDVSVMDAMPADPIRGDNGWTLGVTDDSGGLEGVSIVVTPWMPDHGHGTPVPAEITEMGGGDYQITPLNLYMAGLWEVTFALELGDGSTDEVMFSVCVD